jgi:hypothetical protein
MARRCLFAVAAFVLGVAGAGCAPFHPVARGEFEISYDRWLEHDEQVRGKWMHVRAPAPDAHAEVVPVRGKERVLTRHPDLPARGLPLFVAVGNVAVFETARTVREVELAGDAARAWFTPGVRLFVRGMHAGDGRLRLTMADGQRRILDIQVR